MKGINRKRMAWVLVIAILAGCFANYGAVRAEDRVEKYLYLEGDSPVARLSVSGKNKDMLSGTLAVTGSAVGSLFESESSGNFYVTTGGALSVTGGAVTAGTLIKGQDAIDQIINESNALKNKIDYTVGKSNGEEDTKYDIQLSVKKEKYDSCSDKELKQQLGMYYKPENGQGVYYLGQFDTKRMYKVTFYEDEKGEKEYSVRENIEYNSTIDLPSNPEKIGKTFSYWYYKKDGKKIRFNSTSRVTDDIELYAEWETNKYKVIFYEDEKGGKEYSVRENIEYGNTTDLPSNPEKIGKTFSYWYYKKDGKKIRFDSNSKVTENIEVYAEWETNKYKVTFYKDKEGGKEYSVRENIEYDNTTDLPSNPEKIGYIFGYWYYVINNSEIKFDSTSKITEDIKVYAKWIKKEEIYTITYDPEDGSMPPNYIKQYETGKGLEEKAMPVPSKAGYLFGGWYSGKVRVTGILPSMTGNLNLKAKWYAISITCDQNKKYVAKGTVLTLGVEIDSSIEEQCKFIWSNGQLEKEGATVTYEVETVGTQKYICKVVYGSYSQSVAIEINGYIAKIDITLYKTKSTKDIFGKKVPLETLAFAKNKKKNKKYLTLNKSKGTIKVKKYVKSVKLALKVEGQKITVTVSVKLPKPKIKVKKIKNIYRGYDSYKLTYSNIKGADRIVLYYSRKKNKGYKKGGKRQNRKKGVKVSIPKGSKYYYKVVAYYGKTKSPQSTIAWWKGGK